MFVPFSNFTDPYRKWIVKMEWIQTEMERQRFLRHPMSYYYRYHAFSLRTFSDMTSSFINPTLYQSVFQSDGIIPPLKEKASAIYLGQMFRSAMLQVLINPEEGLCNLINDHIEKLKKRHMIGIQIRVGGSESNYKERRIQGYYAVNHFFNEVIRYMKKEKIKPQDVFVYISTDSDIFLSNISELFKKIRPDMVYSVTDFRIGHSAIGKTYHGDGDAWKEYSSRALMDLLILKESDFLVFSQGSSYGQFSHELQQTYNNPISPKEYLEAKGLKCSVYGHRKFAGKARIIKKTTSRMFVPLESL